MTRIATALAPTEAPPPPDLGRILERLADAIETLAQVGVLELKLFTPAEAASLLGKTENWVIEAAADKRIYCTYVGKSPRLTAKHIRQIAAAHECKPSSSRAA